jgi:hypothetical protein
MNWLLTFLGSIFISAGSFFAVQPSTPPIVTVQKEITASTTKQNVSTSQIMSPHISRSNLDEVKQYSNDFLDNGKQIYPDSSTFVVIKPAAPDCLGYAKDKDHVYDRAGSVIPNADPVTFTVVDSCANYGDYAKDANHVFFGSYVVNGADPKTFSFIGGEYFGKDARHVFYRDSIIQNVDVNSFMPIEDTTKHAPLYSKDKYHVFASSPQSAITHIVEGADTSTFKAIDPEEPASCGADCYYDAQDNHHKYFEGSKVQ